MIIPTISKPHKTTHRYNRFVLFSGIITLFCFASTPSQAQPGYEFSQFSDTVKSRFLNRSTYKIYNRNGLLVEQIRLKNKKRNGFTEKYQNQILVEKTDFKKGEKDGLSETYYAKDKPRISAYYKAGFLAGKYKEYYSSGSIKTVKNYSVFTIDSVQKSEYQGDFTYFDQNGEINTQGYYSRGKKSGEWKEYRNGILVKTENFKNGDRHGEYAEYYPDGLTKRSGIYYAHITVGGEEKHNIQDGPIQSFYNTGQLEILDTYKMGLRSGAYEKYYINGQLSYNQYHEAGEPTGKWQYYEQSGALISETNYQILETETGKKGYKHGLERRWKNEVLVYQMSYAKDKANGLEKTWHANGSLAGERIFVDGLLDGKSTTWYENGNIESMRYYATVLDYRNERKTISKGWRYNYDLNGQPQSSYFADSLGENLISKTFFDGKPLSYAFANFISIDYAPGGSLNSFIVAQHIYYPSFAQYYFMDGNIRKIGFQNPKTEIENYIDFDYKGTILSVYNSQHENVDSLNAPFKIAEKIAAKHGRKLLPNSFYTDTVKHGNYTLNYADNTIAAKMEFDDDLPNGDFVFYAPLNGDTLWYQHYEKGYPTGYYVKKYGGEQLSARGIKRKNGLPNDSEDYSKSGIIRSKQTFHESDSSLTREEYYEDGTPKSKTNDLRNLYYNYYADGKPSYENYLMPNDTSLKVAKYYFPKTGQLKSIAFYRNNQQDSLELRYFENAQIMVKSYFEKNERHGTYTQYNPDGSLRQKGDFIHGKREGLWLESTEHGVDTVYYENNKRVLKPSALACNCVDTTQASGTIGFANSLSYMLDYSAFKSILPGYITPVDSLNYNRIFYTGFQATTGYRRMNLILFGATQFNIPANEQIQITLNPCRTKGYLSRMEASISFANGLDNLYADLYPKRISMAFISGPIESNDNNYKQFTASFDIREISLSPTKPINYDFNKNPNSCFTKGILKNFLTVEIEEAEPYVFNAFYHSTEFQVKDEEWKNFYGIVASKANLAFTLSTASVPIIAYCDMLAIGGEFASGKLQVPCTIAANEQYEILDSNGEKQLISPEKLKALWMQKGFTRLKFEHDSTLNQLKIYFFAE